MTNHNSKKAAMEQKEKANPYKAHAGATGKAHSPQKQTTAETMDAVADEPMEETAAELAATAAEGKAE